MMKKTLVLVSMALVVAVVVAGIAGGTSSPSVYASRVAGISAAGETGINIQNLDQSENAAVSADFYASGGGLQSTINVGSVGPMSAANIFLPSTNLPTGAYAAIINADKQIAAIARTDWNQSHGAAIYSNVLPSTEIALPLAVRDYYSQSSLVSIQNTDQTASASVTVKVYASGQTAPAFTQTYQIPPGTSITLDMGEDVAFASLGSMFLGSLTVESATEIGVQSFVDIRNSAKAVYAFEGVPAEMASETLYSPLFRSRQYVRAGDPSSGRLDTGISVVNPGDTEVTAQITYYGADNPAASAACRGQTFTSPQQTIAPKSSYVFYQGGSTEGLPADCFGSAVVRSTGGGVLAIVNDSQNEGMTAAAFNAVTAEQGATTVALPLYRRNHVGLNTGISIMNVGDAEANATISFTPAGASGPAACGNCSFTIPPNSIYVVWPPSAQGVPDSYGAAVIQSSQPVAVIVNDFSLSGATDAATYNGIKADAQ
jgi:hypothetical protein